MIDLRATVREALAAPGAPTQAALAAAADVTPQNLNAWLHGRRTIPVRAIEAALQHLDIEPEARAELARLRGEIERAEARIRELVG